MTMTLTTTPAHIEKIARLVAARLPVLVHGAPGIGKTAHVAARVASCLNAELRPFIASHHDPVAIHGLPAPDFEARTTKALINEFFHTTIRAAEAGRSRSPPIDLLRRDNQLVPCALWRSHGCDTGAARGRARPAG